MKTLGYVNMFNRGVGQVQADLKENGNPPAEFVVNLLTAFRVNVTDVEKVATTNEKVATSGQKVATPDDNIATGKKYKLAEEMAIYILEYCETWRSIASMMMMAMKSRGYSKQYLRKNIRALCNNSSKSSIRNTTTICDVSNLTKFT